MQSLIKPLARIQNDVALRGGLISAGMTLLALLLLSIITWLFLEERLETRIEEALTERHEIAIANRNVLSDEDRKVIRRFRRSLPIRDEGVFAWIDSEGATFSGNVSGLDCRQGFYDRWLNVSESGESMPEVSMVESKQEGVHDRFRFLAKEQGENCLVFGRSLYEVDALKNNVLGLFVWLVPIALLPAVFISLKQSWKLRRRLQNLSNVVQSVCRGDLEARVPVEGRDDIDRLGLSANRSFDQLQESVSTLQHLTSVMAHDLRAPLNRMSIPLDEAMRANESGETAVASLEIVKSGLDDVREVFDALLRISQIESGQRRSNFAQVDLFDIAEVLFEIYQPVVEDANQTLEFEIVDEGTSLIVGDAELIRQAAVNLIENAIRYSPVEAVIRLGVSRDPINPALFVRDNGPGLPEAERPKVLRRLYRYQKSTGGKSGHGLGLSLVKAVVLLHEGEIVLEDANPGLLVRLCFDSVSDAVASLPQVVQADAWPA